MIVISICSGVLVITNLITLVWTKLHNFKRCYSEDVKQKTEEVIKSSVIPLLLISTKREIEDIYYKTMEESKLYDYQRKYLIELYGEYIKLGGNSCITKIFEEMMSYKIRIKNKG